MGACPDLVGKFCHQGDNHWLNQGGLCSGGGTSACNDGATSIMLFQMDVIHRLTLSEIRPDAVTTDFTAIARRQSFSSLLPHRLQQAVARLPRPLFRPTSALRVSSSTAVLPHHYWP